MSLRFPFLSDKIEELKFIEILLFKILFPYPGKYVILPDAVYVAVCPFGSESKKLSESAIEYVTGIRPQVTQNCYGVFRQCVTGGDFFVGFQSESFACTEILAEQLVVKMFVHNGYFLPLRGI